MKIFKRRIYIESKKIRGSFIIHKKGYKYYYFVGVLMYPDYYDMFRLSKENNKLYVRRMGQWRLISSNIEYHLE